MGFLFAHRNLAETPGAEISTDSEALGLGVRSLLTPQISDIYRSAPWAATTINLRLLLPASATLRLFLLAAPRDGLLPPAGCTVRLTASNVALDGTDALDTGAVAFGMGPHGLWAHLPAADITARWVRFRFTGVAGWPYLQLGRLWVGPALITVRNPSYGWTRGGLDTGTNDRAALSGTRYGRRGAVARRQSFALDTMSESEGEALLAAALEAATTGQVFAAPFADQLASTGILGTLGDIPDLSLPYHQNTATSLTLVEDR